MNDVLLVGRLSNGYSWDSLVKDLIDSFYFKNKDIFDKNKSFTLMYEEILSQAIKNTTRDESEIVEIIIDKIQLMKTYEYHNHLNNNNFDA